MSITAHGLILFGYCATAALLFQNCSPMVQQQDPRSQQLSLPQSSFSYIGGKMTDSISQSLRFKTGDGIEFQSLAEVSNKGSEIGIRIKNTTTGRHAEVLVAYNPSTQKFLSVKAVRQPHMCFDHTRAACAMVPVPAGYEQAGSLVANCSSSIQFDGSIIGSVGGLASNLQCTGTIEGISTGLISANVPMSCDFFNPTAIQQLSVETISWLAEILPNGLTRHHHWLIARQLGYNGELGIGGHSAFLNADPARLTAFEMATTEAASSQVAGVGSLRQHYANQRLGGYKGLFICGGAACYLANQCDEYGRLK